MSVFEKVKEVIYTNLAIAEDEFTLEADLMDDLYADTLDMVEIVMDIEEEFDIEINDPEVCMLNTVGDLVKLVEKKLGVEA